MLLQEGYKSIFIAIIVSLFLFIIDCEVLGFIGMIITLFIVYMYRNPIVGFIPKDDDIIMAPIEGKISSIDVKDNNYEVYIDTGVCDAAILRAPKNTQNFNYEILHGMNFCHHTLKAKEFNTRATLYFDDISINLLAGVCNQGIILDSKKNLQTGDKIGLFFQGLVQVIIPKDKYNLDVELMKKIDCETKLATLGK
jgi:hypothetical protein